MDGPVPRCRIGPVPCGNGTAESKTTLAVCKVFAPAIVSKRQPMVRGPHAVIISVSQGQDIVAVQSNLMSVFSSFVVQSLSHGIVSSCTKCCSDNIPSILSKEQGICK